MFNRMVAFLPNYATDKVRQFDIATVPGDRITDLIYCFAGFQQQGQDWVVDFPEPHDADANSKKSNLAKLVALKETWPALNIVVSVGGANHSHQGDPSFKTTPVFSAIAATPEARQKFVASCIELFIKPVHPGIGPLFGGIDIDWEFPAKAERHNLTLLFEEFRSQLDSEGQAQGRTLTLSACCGVRSFELELGQLASTLDWIGIMAYLAHEPNLNPRNQFTGFGGPIFAPSGEPASNTTWNIDGVVTSFLAGGFPAAKLVLGISAYARTYAGVTNANDGLYQTYTGPGPGSLGKRGVLEYKDLMANYLPTYESHWDDVSKSAWLYNPNDQVWISYDSVESAAAKVSYANQKGLGGLMLWELSADALSFEFQAPAPRIPALIDTLPYVRAFGIGSLSNKVVLQATSSSTPALAFLDGRLFLACRKSSGDRLEIMFSSGNGAKFGGTYLSAETSDAAPALAAHNGRLMMAWKGSGNDNLSVAEVSLGDNQGGNQRGNPGKIGIDGLRNKIILSDTSGDSPALASHGGILFLAWKGSGNDNLSVMLSSDGGATFGGKHISPETSGGAPALASHNGRLMIAWKGSGDDNLSVAEVSLTVDDGGNTGIVGLTNKIILGDGSDRAPALTSNLGRLFLAWKRSGDGSLSISFSSDNGASFGGNYVSQEVSDQAPALASDGRRMPLAWKGSGNDQLSISHVFLV